MTEAKVVKELNATARDVFDVLCVFDSIKAGGPIEAVRYEGEGIGMIRHISMNGGVISERLDVLDSNNLTMTYSILNDDSPLPFLRYSATIQITADGDDACTVSWVGHFEAEGDEEVAINTATGIYAGGIKGAKQALGLV